MRPARPCPGCPGVALARRRAAAGRSRRTGAFRPATPLSRLPRRPRARQRRPFPHHRPATARRTRARRARQTAVLTALSAASTTARCRRPANAAVSPSLIRNSFALDRRRRSLRTWRQRPPSRPGRRSSPGANGPGGAFPATAAFRPVLHPGTPRRPAREREQTIRHGLAKLVNSLSWHPRLTPPTPIDGRRLVYRIDLRHYRWTARSWDRLAATDPYRPAEPGPLAAPRRAWRDAISRCCAADWFIAAASRPPFYHDFLQMPASDRALERLLQIDVPGNIEDDSAVPRRLQRLRRRPEQSTPRTSRRSARRLLAQLRFYRQHRPAKSLRVSARPRARASRLPSRRRRDHLPPAQRPARVSAHRRRRTAHRSRPGRHRQRSETSG